MRKLWRYSISVLGVFVCLLLSTFFTKNTNAAVVETNAPTSGVIGCGVRTTPINWYTNRSQFTSRCGEWSDTQNIQNSDVIYRLTISFDNTNNEYKFKDKDAYALVTFGMAIQGTGFILPTGFFGRGVVSVIENNVQHNVITNQIIGRNAGGYSETMGDSTSLILLNNSTTALYNLKIRIPKDEVWDGKLDLIYSLTMPDNANIYKILVTDVKLEWIYDPNATIGQEAQKELEDRTNLESQSQQTSGDANSAEQQISSGTSSLIGVVTSFSGAMVGVHRTNCKLPRITAYNFDLGELDLCTYSPPAWIQTITSAVVSLIVVRLAYKIFKRIMGIAKGISQ